MALLFTEESADAAEPVAADAAEPAAAADATSTETTKNGADKATLVCKICDKTFARATSLKVALFKKNGPTPASFSFNLVFSVQCRKIQ